MKLNDSRISNPEILKSQVGRPRAEKNVSTFSQIIAYAPVQFKLSGFRDLDPGIVRFHVSPWTRVRQVLMA
jgi:hypothetical protein